MFSKFKVISEVLAVMSYLTGDEFKTVVDRVLDAIEDVGGERVDAACAKIRGLLNVPDSDEVQK